MPEIHINLAGATHSIVIEQGLLARLGEIVRKTVSAQRVFLAVDANIKGTHGRVAVESLQQSGIQYCVHELTAREDRKTLETAREMYDAMLRAKLDRSSAVLAM